MTTDDDKVSRRYRELAREEPPRRVDEAILAAARRGADARPAPLVVPTGRRRWYFPLAAAAIIVLAVAVTVHMERQQRSPELAEAPVQQEPHAAVPAPAPSRELRAQRNAEVLAEAQKPQLSQSAPAAPAPAAVPEASGRRDAATEKREEAPAIAAASGLAKASPEQWLQGIADLRRQGRHEEADKALAEFRRSHPDYRISEAMLHKLERG